MQVGRVGPHRESRETRRIKSRQILNYFGRLALRIRLSNLAGANAYTSAL
jgi:hypothetical protein